MREPEFPDWVIKQRGRQHRDGSELGYLNRNRLIRRYARHMQSEGQLPTFAAIRSMLAFVDRGYSMKADQISRALSPLYRSKDAPLPKAPNGWPVSIEGRSYRSARSAAEEVGVSVQTVLRRIASKRPEWAQWVRSDG